MIRHQNADAMVLASALTQNRDYTKARLLGFSYDFDVTIIRHQNADAMVQCQCAYEKHSPPDNIQNGGRPGGMPLIRHNSTTKMRKISREKVERMRNMILECFSAKYFSLPDR